jgi:hypothetical protein
MVATRTVKEMRRRRALITFAIAVAVIATGTAAAAANFGLLGTSNQPSPAGHLDLATVQASIGAGQANVSEITVPLPSGTEADADQPPNTTAATTSTTPVTAPHRGDDHGSPDGHDDGDHDDD